ncbi:MAG: Eco57I restriction-modification methylase domain-containing protein [bacterium]
MLYENLSFKKTFEIQDFFHDLYESFIPPIIRHSFGEYYTPYWLADLTIETALDEKNITHNDFTLIDTTCGSGTFLINAIKRKIDNNISVKSILQSIKGIDLNPLAVLMAKINYFINIFPLIENKETIEIPIYLGDATYTPQIAEIKTVKVLTYDLLTSSLIGNEPLEITLPYSLVKRENFISVMEELEFYVLRKKNKGAFDYIISEIKKTEEKSLPEELKNKIEKFINILVEYEKNNLNSVWLRIFANYLKTGSLDKFDLVVGNPPWISWNVLPENYRKQVKEKCKIDGLFSNDKNVGGNNLNICALIANRSLETFMKDDGVLSYIMPKSILFNKSFEGFRNFYIESKSKRAYLQKVLDWEKGGNPFESVQLPFAIYIFSFKKIDYTKGIELIEYIKKKDEILNNQFYSFSKIKPLFDIKKEYLIRFSNERNNNFTVVPDKKSISEIKLVIGKNEYYFRKGIGANPGEVYRIFFKKNIDDKLAEFGLFEKKGKLLKQSNKTVILEKSFIKPLILSPDIKSGNCNWNNLYVVFPYEEGGKKPIPEIELKQKAPNILKYLKLNYNKISKQSAYNTRIQNFNDFYGIIRIGNYSYANYFVAIRDNTKMAACVVSKIKTHWGENKIPLFDGHVSYISEREKGGNIFIKEEEANYIAKKLNNPVIALFVKNSTDSRSIGTKLPIKIEKFIDKRSQYNIKEDIDEAEKFVSYLPVYSLEAAATKFGREEYVENSGWMKATVAGKKLNKDMFIAKVVGKSMETTIPDGSYCIFRFDKGGSRNETVVLVESRQVADPETNQKFTVKRYHSKKEYFKDGSWIHKRIILSPVNKEFEPIILENVPEMDFRIVAEFIGVI